MASLKVWNGDIEPVGQLIETWIQIRGVPPKWSDWTTIKEIASSLGKILEVDWQILFSTFFTVIRVKINCKDPSKIPEKRTMEMDDKLYMINFKMEDLDKLKEKIDGPDEDPDGDTKNGDEGDNGQEEGKVNSSSGDKTLDFEPGTGEEGDNSDKSANQDPTTTQKTAARTQSMRMSLLFLEEKEGQEPNFQSCVDLLSAMELHDSDEESDLLDTDKADEEKMIHLPTEWQFPDFNLITPFAVDGTEESHPSSEVTTSDQLGPEERGPTTKEIKNLQKASNEKPAEKKKWGPIEAERKSKRGTNDGRSVLEKAQDAKRRWSEGITKGKPSKPPPISKPEILCNAKAIGISGKDGSPVNDSCISDILAIESNRGICFSDSCNTCCTVDNVIVDPSESGEIQGADPESSKDTHPTGKGGVSTSEVGKPVAGRRYTGLNDRSFLEH